MLLSLRTSSIRTRPRFVPRYRRVLPYLPPRTIVVRTTLRRWEEWIESRPFEVVYRPREPRVYRDIRAQRPEFRGLSTIGAADPSSSAACVGSASSDSPTVAGVCTATALARARLRLWAVLQLLLLRRWARLLRRLGRLRGFPSNERLVLRVDVCKRLPRKVGLGREALPLHEILELLA